MKRFIVFLALFLIPFSVHSQEEEVPPEKWTVPVEEETQATQPPGEELALTEEEIQKLEEYARQTEECLKGCRKIDQKIQSPTEQIQNLIKQQQNLLDQLFQATDLYDKTIDLCKVLVLESKKNKSIQLGNKESGISGHQEIGSIIPSKCRHSLAKIKKDIANILNQLADLIIQSKIPQKEIANLESQLSECLKNCEEFEKSGLHTSKKIKKLMEQGSASPLSIEALAHYDAADESMKRRLNLAHDGKLIRESIINSSKKITHKLTSYKPPLWGISINRKDWSQIGFSNRKSIARAAAPYSGGLYIPAIIEKSFSQAETTKLLSLSKLPQQVDIPRYIQIIAPDTAIPGMPVTLSVFDEKDTSLPGITIETDTGKTFKSDENGKVHIPSLTSESIFALLWVPGTAHGSAIMGFPKKMTKLPETEAQLRIDSATDIVLLGSTVTIHGAGFDGFADSTEINMGGKTITPLAESPISSKFRIPEDIEPGSYTVTITEKFKEPANLPILCIKLDLNANNIDLKKGETTKGIIRVQGTERPLLIELINDSPSEILINPHVVTVKGGKGLFEIKGLNPGPFLITIGAIQFPRK